MNKKLKIALIAVEAFLLVVLILVAIGYQQKWLITTDDGPRFDWYAIQEDLTIDIQDIPDKRPEPEDIPGTPPASEPENTTDPASTAPPATVPTPTTEPTEPSSAPEQTTEPTEPSSAPEQTTELETTHPTEDWETDEF